MPRRKLLLTQEQVDQNLRFADRLEALLTFSAEREKAKRRIQELLLVLGVETDRYDPRDFLRKVYVVGRDKCGWPPLPEDGSLYPALWNNPKYEWRDAISDLESAAALQHGANLAARKDANNPLKCLLVRICSEKRITQNTWRMDAGFVKSTFHKCFELNNLKPTPKQLEIRDKIISEAKELGLDTRTFSD